MSSAPTNPTNSNRPAWLYALAVDVLTYALSVIVAVRITVDRPTRWAIAVVLVFVFCAVYAVGSRSGHRRQGPAAAVWFAILAALWVAVMIMDSAGVFLGFAVFFVALDRFSLRTAVMLVAAATATIAMVELTHQGDVNPAAIIGPTIGAAIAIIVTVGYKSLARENEQRRVLIAELKATRADLAASERSRGALEERERLARDIHDTVAQGLASVIILVSNAERDLRTGDGPAALDQLSKAHHAANDSLEDARRLVRDLAPADLDQASLEAAVARLCANAEGTGDLEVTLTVAGTPAPVPTAIEVALLRIAQSGLANITTHAAAEHARITLTYLDDRVMLDIYDDGRGFDPDCVPDNRATGTGFGLVAMRQRLEPLGGTLTIESQPGAGTVLAVQIPVPTIDPYDASIAAGAAG